MDLRWSLFAAVWAISSINATALAFDFLGSRWPQPTATIHADLLQDGAVSPSGSGWNDAFREAADSWGDDTPFIFEVLEEISDPCAGLLPSVPEDGFRNGVGFALSDCGLRFGMGTLAVTTVYSRGGVTTEADIVFNQDFAWDVYRGPWLRSVVDFRRVAAHELGHVVGLDHEDDTLALMASIILEGSTVESPSQDDIHGVIALYGADDPFEPLSPVVLQLEEPGPDDVRTGVSNLRGWVVSLAGIQRLELYVDDAYQGLVPFGGRRTDVARVFPHYPDAFDSGFSQTFNYSNLTSAEHLIKVRAFDRLGRSAEASARFEVLRFDAAFIADPGAIDETQASVALEDNGVRIRNLFVEGSHYEILLQWRSASQRYEIVELLRHQ